MCISSRIQTQTNEIFYFFLGEGEESERKYLQNFLITERNERM